MLNLFGDLGTRVRQANTTFAPRDAMSIASAFPIPLLAPVIKQDFPSILTELDNGSNEFLLVSRS
ncbi:MAG: hypothetical protein OXG05_15855 [Gammaproteobacteria bacterium]|nr:hypothetical protein [Gammaproteobacteria bacterium]